MISESTRRDIIDGLTLDNINWSGRLNDVEFLNRIFKLSSLPSDDDRFSDMEGDIWQHRINNFDMPDDWVYYDDRLDLLGCSDEQFLKFLTEMVHPVVRPDQVASRELVRNFNVHLKGEGFELLEVKQISGRPVYSAQRIDERSESIPSVPIVARDIDRIWKKDQFRLFVSHVSKFKSEVSELKHDFENFNISCFVAHEDIEPSREWQIEIENALRTMDALLAYMTPDFHSSMWTDQEIGFAICRKVVVIPIRIGVDPYGFLAKTQGINGVKLTSSALASRIYDLLSGNENCSKRINHSTIEKFVNTVSYEEAKENFERLRQLKVISREEIDRIEHAFQNNRQLNGAYYLQSRFASFLEIRRKEALRSETSIERLR